jgi:hypothetical protein
VHNAPLPATTATPTPSTDGVVEVFHCPPRTVVWLKGPIDVALDSDLAAVATSVPQETTEIVVDVARMTFGDLTAARFIAQIGAGRCVTVRFPSRLTRDLLRVAGLAADVQITGRSRDASYDDLLRGGTRGPGHRALA